MNIVQLPRRFVRSHWGGTETVILETCKRLLMMGHHTEIICPNALAKTDAENIGGVNVRRVSYFYPYLGLSTEAKDLLDRKGGNLFSFSLMKELKTYPNLDMIHLHTAKRPGGIGRYVAKKRGIPYVISLHGGMFDVPAREAETWTAPAKDAFEWGKILGWWVGSRSVMDDAAAIICVGREEERKTRERFPHKNVIHLANGVDPDHFHRGNGPGFRKKHHIPQDAYVVVTVGRIDPQKNQLFQINLLPELVKINPRVHLLIIGPVTKESYHSRLIDTVQRSGLESRITVIEGLDAEGQDLVDAYHASDLFLLPSVHEPFGIVILEAWAAGLPVVASRIGGIPSFVEDGKDGLLFEPNNTGEFIAAFETTVNSPEKALQLSSSGKMKACDMFSWDKITRDLVRIYEEAIRENPFRK